MRAYTADMIPGGASPVINVSQYDNDYAVTVTLIEGAEIYTPPSGATIMVVGTKPDGNGFSYACTYQGNVVTVPIYTQMTAVAGRFPIELVVYQSGLRVGSCNITLAVERAPLDNDEIISDSDIPAIIALAQAQADAAASSAASAETAKTAAMDAAQDAIDAAQELQTAIQFNAALIHATASGAVASFSDGADNIPMQSVVDEITPVQNLNGQANPYPPGGGKNKLPDNGEASAAKYGVTFTRNADGTIKAVGTATDVGRSTFDVGHVVLPAGTYTISGCPSGGTDATYRIRIARDSYMGTALAQEYGTGKTITLTAETDVYLRIYIQPDSGAVNQTWKPQIESGSTATAYAPYSNICPISGRTGLTVTKAGKNLCEDFTESSTCIKQGEHEYKIIKTGTTIAGRSANADCALKANVSYIISLTADTANISGLTIAVRAHMVDGENTGRISLISNGANEINYTPTKDVEYLNFYLGTESESIGAYVIIKNLMVRPASITDDTYEPYTATEIPITWESIAGTVYGGTLDVVSGVLTVDKGYINYDGSENWNWQDGGTYKRAAVPLTDVYNPGGRVSVQSNAGTFRASGNDVGTIFASGTTLLYYPDASITSLADYKTWLASNNLQIVYPLATLLAPIQVSPTEVRTLLGGNTIYTDAGSVSVEYVADTKLYIDNKVAELQALILEH